MAVSLQAGVAMRVCQLNSIEVPPQGRITICERDGNLIHEELQAALYFQNDTFPEYEHVNVPEDHTETAYWMAPSKNAFLATSQRAHLPLWHRIVDAWHSDGIGGVLDIFKSRGHRWPIIVEKGVAILRRVWCLFLGIFFPLMLMTPDEIADKYGSSCNDRAQRVRSMAWHPQWRRLAVALRNDVVMLFTAGVDIVPRLRHRRQRKINCVAWRPMCSSIVAVGCESDVVLWDVDPNSRVARPTAHCAAVLPHSGPVTGVAWHPQGLLLAVACPTSKDIRLWDTSMGVERCMILRTFSLSTSGFSQVNWSPNGHRLAALSIGKGFRIWETTEQYECIHYPHTPGRVTSLVWSEDGCHALFGVDQSAERAVYALSLNPANQRTTNVATAAQPRSVIDFSGTNISNCSGHIQQMVWDRKSQRLAISFKGHSDLILLFRTRTKPLLDLNPIGFIRVGGIVQSIAFCGAEVEGTVLTVQLEAVASALNH